MNATEAKKIIREWESDLHNPNYAPNEFTEKKWARASGYLEALEGEEISVLRAEIKEWLCVKCRTVYPGPPQSGFACVQCPKCGGDCAPRNWMELQEERRRSKELLEALVDMVAQHCYVEKSRKIEFDLDSSCLSANADAMRLLGRLGELEIDDRGMRVVFGKWPQKAVKS